MQDNFRRSTLTLPLPGSPLAAAVGVVTIIVQRAMRIARAQLCLWGTGTGAGATTVNVNVNGNPINAAASLSIAGAAGTNAVACLITTDSQYPGGFRVNPGDTVTVDIAAVPATTQPKGGFVALDVEQLDI